MKQMSGEAASSSQSEPEEDAQPKAKKKREGEISLNPAGRVLDLLILAHTHCENKLCPILDIILHNKIFNPIAAASKKKTYAAEEVLDLLSQDEEEPLALLLPPTPTTSKSAYYTQIITIHVANLHILKVQHSLFRKLHLFCV